MPDTTERLKRSLNDYLAEMNASSMQWPEFLESIHINALHFGHLPPSVEITDIQSAPTPSTAPHHVPTETLSIAVRMEYEGDAKFSLQTALRLELPMGGAMSLPIAISASHVRLQLHLKASLYDNTVHVQLVPLSAEQPCVPEFIHFYQTFY